MVKPPLAGYLSVPISSFLWTLPALMSLWPSVFQAGGKTEDGFWSQGGQNSILNSDSS
jgi:hypothetical protein